MSKKEGDNFSMKCLLNFLTLLYWLALFNFYDYFKFCYTCNATENKGKKVGHTTTDLLSQHRDQDKINHRWKNLLTERNVIS